MYMNYVWIVLCARNKYKIKISIKKMVDNHICNIDIDLLYIFLFSMYMYYVCIVLCAQNKY